MQKIDSDVFKRLNLIKNVTSKVEQILSSVDVTNAQIKDYIVNSSIGDITSSVNTKIKAYKVVTSVLEPIQSIVEVIIPVDVEKPIYAIVNAIENQSNTFTIQNSSSISSIENRTRLEVI